MTHLKDTLKLKYEEFGITTQASYHSLFITTTTIVFPPTCHNGYACSWADGECLQGRQPSIQPSAHSRQFISTANHHPWLMKAIFLLQNSGPPFLDVPSRHHCLQHFMAVNITSAVACQLQRFLSYASFLLCTKLIILTLCHHTEWFLRDQVSAEE